MGTDKRVRSALRQPFNSTMTKTQLNSAAANMLANRLWSQCRYMSKLILPVPPCKNDPTCMGQKVIDAVKGKIVDKCMVGKNIAYVGGFGSIGFACCKQMITAGAKQIVVLDVKGSCQKQRVLHCTDPKVALNYVKLNLCEGRDAIDEALTETIQHMGHIDILVNGSGVIDDRDPAKTMEVNLMGVVETTLAAIPLMSHASGGKGGLIVNISSVWGLEPAGFIAVYTASKHAIIGFTRSLAHDLYCEHTGIVYMAICPGPTVQEKPINYVGKDTFRISQPLSENMMGLKRQPADQCAVQMLKAMKTYENGSVWIVAGGKLQKVKMATYWDNPFRKH